jgi:hypothetical protein
MPTLLLSATWWPQRQILVPMNLPVITVAQLVTLATAATTLVTAVLASTSLLVETLKVLATAVTAEPVATLIL